MTTTQLAADSSARRCSDFVRVADILPFFRYAVGPTSQYSPAIPYFTRNGAESCFAEMVRELPWAGAIMYRRTWRGLVTVREYRPNPTGQPPPRLGGGSVAPGCSASKLGD